jgi:hypothetical protein
MITFLSVLLGTFTTPEKIGTTPQSMIWLLPLTMAIAVVYKATKVPKITFRSFLKETVVLFCSVVIFIGVAALVLFVMAWLIIG